MRLDVLLQYTSHVTLYYFWSKCTGYSCDLRAGTNKSGGDAHLISHGGNAVSNHHFCKMWIQLTFKKVKRMNSHIPLLEHYNLNHPIWNFWRPQPRSRRRFHSFTFQLPSVGVSLIRPRGEVEWERGQNSFVVSLNDLLHRSLSGRVSGATS